MLTMLPPGDYTPPNGTAWPELAVDLEPADAQRYFNVKPERLRQWVARGHIRRGSVPRTVDMGSVLTYLWQRQQNGEPTCQP